VNASLETRVNVGVYWCVMVHQEDGDEGLGRNTEQE